MKIGIIVGSLSRNSINRRLALALAPQLEARGATVTHIPIADLPLFNRDIESPLPAAAAAFRAAIADQDALVFVTPEYNRTFSSAIKNATEWGGRPLPASVFAGKPAAVTGATPSRLLTIAAQQQLRGNLAALGMPVAPAELYVHFKGDHFPADGSIQDPMTAEAVGIWADQVLAHFAAFAR